jgi:large subunit ribosomal protein L25
MAATLQATTRDTRGKNEGRRLRRGGRLPAVVYGGAGAGAVPVAVDPKELMRILHSESGVNTLIGLSIDGGADTRVMVREYQLDPVTHELLHADFYQVAMDRVVAVTVPILLRGEARGVKQQGGLVDFVHREVEIECLPADIPEHIEVDITELLIGQSIRLRDLAVDPRWTMVSEPDMMIVHVVAPRAEAEPAAAEAAPAAAAAPAAEPEVIKRGKAEKGEKAEPGS